MYCLQWLIPVLLIPKHFLHPTYLLDQALFMWIYVVSFFIERRPCYVCSFLFIAAVLVMCYNDGDKFALWPLCHTVFNDQVCSYAIEEQNLAT